MKYSSYILIFQLSLFSLLLQPSQSTTYLVDGYSEWKNPNVHVGDSVIFNHKYHYNLYIFQNRNAFNLCNFTQATLLTKPTSTSYTWHASRPGFYYFTFNNGSLKTCGDSQKLSIKVSPMSPPAEIPTPSPEQSPVAAPAPSSGGLISSSPAYPWPFRPRQAASSPGPAPCSATSVTVPTVVPDKGGGMPFINSNPAVPLPTGEVDSATIRPLPTSDHGKQMKVGFLGGQMALFSVVLLML